MGILTQTKDGLRFSGDDMLFQAGSTNGNAPTTLMTLKSDNKLGIGITQPLQRFHVEGTAYFGGGTNVAFQSGGDVHTSTAIVIDKGDRIKVRSGQYLRDLLHQDSTNSIIKIGQSGTSLIAGINLEPGHDGNSTGAQVRVYGGGTEYVRFDGYNKRVGIGVTNPTVKLDVDGDIKATGIVKSTGPVSVNNRSALSVAHWAGSSSTTGAIKITVPGSHSSNWSMFVLRITTYEYNSNNHTVYYVSGHDWTSQWYNYGVTKNGKSDKDIKFGYDSNDDYIILGETNSTWSYGHVTVDVIAHPSFYSSSMDITTGWGISQVTSLSGITTQSVVNRRVVTTKTASGHVGIGTDSPSYGLDVAINPGSGGIATRLTQGDYKVRINGMDLLGYSSDRLWMISNNNNSSFIAATNWDWDTTCEYFYTPSTAGAGNGVLTIGQINKNNANWTHGHTRFKVGGSDKVAITTTGLGVGTNSPSSLLHISSGTSGDAVLTIEADTDNSNEEDNPRVELLQDGGLVKTIFGSNGNSGSIYSGSLDNAGYITSNTNHLQFGTNDIARMTIASDKVGIGTNAPGYRLDILGAGVLQRIRTTTSSQYAEMHFENDNNQKLVVGSIGSTYSNSAWAGMRYIYSTSGDLAIKSAAAIRFYGNTLATGETARITSTGLGIGTTSPTAKLDVQGPSLGSSAGNTALHAVIQGTRHHLDFVEERTAAGSDWTNTTYRLGMRVDVTDHQSIDFVSDANAREHIDIRTGNRVFHSRFTYDGRLGIGTTAPGYHLEVYGSSPNIMINNTAETNAGLLFQDSADTGQSAAIKYNSSDNALRFYNHSYNTERMAIYKDGSYKINGQRGLMVRSIDESNYFSFNDESTTADFEQQLPYTGGGGSVAKVDDSTAPAPGCFEITGAYYSDIHASNRYIKVDINSEYTWEAYVKFVSGTDTDQRIYLGWGMWNASKSYFGNTQRYWGAAAVQVDADSNNSDWVLIRGTISGVGSNTGQFISGTEYVAPLALLNYGNNTNVIRVCGLRLYKSSKNASKIQLGRSGASSVATLNVNTEYPQYRTTLENNGNDGMRVRNDHGYIEIGSMNSGHAHIQTDRTNFYFNREIRVDTGTVSSYNEDLKLSTANAGAPVTRIQVKRDTGDVGIGITAPQSKLHVSSGDTAGTSILVGESAAWGDSSIRFVPASTNYMGIGFTNGTSASTNALDAIAILRTGKVGIGKTNPVAHFEVDPNNYLNANAPGPVPNILARFGGSVTIRSTNYLSLDDSYYNHACMRYNSSGGEARYEMLGYYGIDFKTRSTTKMVIKGDNGFVGIGTTSPGTKLHVSDGEIRISNSYGTKDIAQYYNTLTFKGDANCQFYFGTSQHPSYMTMLPVHTGKLSVTGHLYAGAAVQTITTTSGTINLDAGDYGVFRLTSALTGATTLNVQSMKSGQVIDVILSGNQTVTLTSDDSSETFYRIGSSEYDGTTTNHLQIVCISDSNSAAIYHYTVTTIASDNTI